MPAEQDAIFARIKRLVIERTLHHYYDDKDAQLRDRVRRRMQATGCDQAAYLALLERDDDAEWIDLEAEITIGETFFFRFADQFDALSGTILPGLLSGRAAQRRLRIWSAGCSTGAEPYSVAILLHRLLGPALADWDISILGTDISETALQAARAGEFGAWALRALSPEEIARDFLPVAGAAGRRWRLRPPYRGMVRFERRNLLGLLRQDSPGSPDEPGCDLILCRNVLIYFRPDRVRALVAHFADRLAPDGWLLLGHAEAIAAHSDRLRPVQVAGTIAWQRVMVPGPVPPGPVPLGPVPPGAAPLPAAPKAAPLPAAPVATPAAAPGPAPPMPAIVPPRQAPDDPAGDPEAAAIERVRSMADRGAPAEALAACRADLARHPLCAALFFYAALLQRALGHEAEAEADFRRAIYLCKQFVMAHYHLGLLLNDDGRAGQGRRAIAEAARIAATLPPDSALECGDGMTAGRLLQLSRLDWTQLGGAA